MRIAFELSVCEIVHNWGTHKSIYSDRETTLYATEEELRAAIEETYKGRRRQKMYLGDDSDHIGWVYKMGKGFTYDDDGGWGIAPTRITTYSHHWVTVTEVHRKPRPDLGP